MSTKNHPRPSSMCAHGVGADGGKTAGGLRRRQTIRTRREVAKDIVSWRTRRAPQRIRRSRYHERCLVDQILPGRTISTPCLLCTRRRFHTRRSSCRRWGAGGPNSARSRTVALSLLSPVASARLITGAVKGPRGENSPAYAAWHRQLGTPSLPNLYSLLRITALIRSSIRFGVRILTR